MKKSDFSKILFFATVFVLMTGLPFLYGLYSAANKNAVYSVVRSFKINVELAWDSLFKNPELNYLQPLRYVGEGVTVNTAPDNDSLVFMSGFFDGHNGLKLIDRSGKPLMEQQLSFTDIFKDTSYLEQPPANDWQVDLHGAMMLPDGSTIFNFEYNGLVKLDHCGRVVWTVRTVSHHSVELAEDGGYWVPGRYRLGEESVSPFPPFPSPIDVDTVMKVSDDGVVLKEIDLVKLIYKNQLEAVLTANGTNIGKGFAWDEEILHLNKIEELSRDIAPDFPMFEAGDLLLSFRNLNLLMVIDPAGEEIKWWKTGPWIRQHDPEFMAGGSILVFNNNAYYSSYGDGWVTTPDMERVSNIIEYRPETDEYSIVYGGKPGQELLSVIRGKLEPTPAGGLLITEFAGGRVLEINKHKEVVWEYINRHNPGNAAEITEARIYPKNYFTLADWSCGKR
jgi:hypothetical protein